MRKITRPMMKLPHATTLFSRHEERALKNQKRLKVNQLLAALLVFFLGSGVALGADLLLIDAAREQNVEAVQQLLSDGIDPNEKQPDGATALHWAVYQENADVLQSLIEAGADVNIVNRLGTSALFIAAKSGNADLIKRLLEAGANPNLALQLGETPLMSAARAGTAEGVRLLVAAGADVNASESSRQQTALMWATAQGHIDVVRALIEAGADLDARSKIRPMLMYTDATNGGAFDQGVTEQLGGYSPLLFAARQGEVEIAKLLLNAGANIEGVAGNNTSPLVVAAHSGHTALAKLLLEQGANPNTIGAGYTALHAAILRGDLETVEALLEKGAEPNVRLLKPHPVQRASEDWALKTPMVGATPYWIAASFREAEIMRVLADAGADPLLANNEQLSRPRSRPDRDSYMPAVVGGLLSTVQAAIRGDSTRQRYYVQPNPDPNGEEQLALAAVKEAADHGVNLNHTDFTGSTALHDAAARGLPNIVRELASRGADVNALNRRGQTPLDQAIAAAARPNFFGFNTSVPGPTAREVLEEFGAVRSQR